MSSKPNAARKWNVLKKALKVKVRRRPSDGRSSSASSAVPRGRYQADDPEYDTTEMRVLRRYLEETQLETIFTRLLTTLLEEPYLPFNPYPGFVMRFRLEGEKYQMNKICEEWQVAQILDANLQKTHFHDLYVREDHMYDTEVYGLQHVLHGVSPRHLSKYKWAVDSLVPDPEELPCPEGYSNQVMIAMHGRCIFEGVFYHKINRATFRVEHIITGPDSEKAQEVFAESLIAHADRMQENSDRFFVDICIPNAESKKMETWDIKSIKKNKTDFLSKAKEAIEAKQYIELNCVLRLQHGAPVFMGAMLQLCLNFIEITDKIEVQGSQVSYTERPLASLFDGVFLKRVHAEQYVAALSPLVVKEETKFNIKKKKQSRIAIDGLSTEDEIEKQGAFSEDVIGPNRKYFHQKFAELDMVADFPDALHYAILYALMERKTIGDELITELYKMGTNPASRITEIMEYCTCLQDFALALGQRKEDWSIIREEFISFTEAVEEAMLDPDYDHYIDGITTAMRLQGQIKLLLPTDTNVQIFSDSFDVEKTIRLLSGMSWFCKPYVMSIAETMIASTPKLKDSRLSTDVDHGIEPPQLQGFRHEKLVLPSKDTSILDHGIEVPKLIEREAILIQYMVDTHIDDVWHGQLTQLIEADYLTANPYPTFVNRLMEYAMRNDLMFEADGKILESLFATDVDPEDKDNYVFTVPGIDAYGAWSALAVFDPVTIQPMIQMVQDHFQQADFVKSRGPYRVGICLAVSGSGIWYGKMDPYLNEVELHEHIYIQGPAGSYGGAIDLFGDIVHDYVSGLILKNTIPIDGVYFDDVIRFSWEDILNRKSAFLERCDFCLHRKKSIMMKAMSILESHNEWRYVTVKKYFLLHYVQGNKNKPEIFFIENPVAFYQSIFLSPERAAFHYQNFGPEGDPTASPPILTSAEGLTHRLRQARDSANWLEVHRLLLLKDLITKKQHHVCESWRMLHSVAAMIEYAVSMIETLQDLVRVMRESLALYDRRTDKRKEEEEKEEEERVAAMEPKDRKKYLKEKEKQRKQEEARKKKEEEKKRKEEEKKKKEEEKKRKEEEARKKKEEEKKRKEEEKKKKEEERKKKEEEAKKKKEENTNGDEQKKDDKKNENEKGEKEEEGDNEEGEKKEDDGVDRYGRPKMKVGEESDLDAFWNIPSRPPTPTSPPPSPDALTDIPKFQIPINEVVFGQMTMVFHKLIIDICKARISLTPKTLSKYVEDRLQAVIEEAPEIDNFYLAYTDETIETLEELKHMMKQVQDAIAGDVHEMCPKAQSAMTNLDLDLRPEVPKPKVPPQGPPERRRSVLSKISEMTDSTNSGRVNVLGSVSDMGMIELDYMDLSD